MPGAFRELSSCIMAVVLRPERNRLLMLNFQRGQHRDQYSTGLVSTHLPPLSPLPAAAVAASAAATKSGPRYTRVLPSSSPSPSRTPPYTGSCRLLACPVAGSTSVTVLYCMSGLHVPSRWQRRDEQQGANKLKNLISTRVPPTNPQSLADVIAVPRLPLLVLPSSSSRCAA